MDYQMLKNVTFIYFIAIALVMFFIWFGFKIYEWRKAYNYRRQRCLRNQKVFQSSL